MHHFKYCLVFLFASFVISCASQSEPQKLDAFVDNAELKAETYTQEDWEKSAVQYQKLVDAYVNSNRDYTDAEREMAAKAMGRYHALLFRVGLEHSASYIKEMGKILPSYLDGLIEGLNEESKNIEKTFEGLFDEEKIEKSIESLENAFDRIFGDQMSQ